MTGNLYLYVLCQLHARYKWDFCETFYIWIWLCRLGIGKEKSGREEFICRILFWKLKFLGGESNVSKHYILEPWLPSFTEWWFHSCFPLAYHCNGCKFLAQLLGFEIYFFLYERRLCFYFFLQFIQFYLWWIHCVKFLKVERHTDDLFLDAWKSM